MFIRKVDDIFLVGQEIPLIEVPPPNSKPAFNFARDFLLFHIYRMFLRSPDTPPRVRMEDVKKSFPQHTEATIRKRLKQIADFKRAGGSDACYWILRNDTHLPSQEELHEMVSPEQFCANFSTLAGEVRLKDAGYGDRAFLAIDEDNVDELQSKMEDEVKAAPWNTSGALISAMKGKCVLEVHGVADPTGCGQGFSYVRLPSKPPKADEKPQQPQQPQGGPLASPQSKDAEGASGYKRSVIGTDSDLRKLHVKEAKKILADFGMPEEDIKKLSRWDMIDAIRTISTEQAKAGIDTSLSSKFARSGRFSVHDYLRNFRKECQQVFDIQNRVLSQTDPLSSEESAASDAEDESKQLKSEAEQQGRSLLTMLRHSGINISSSVTTPTVTSQKTQKPEAKEKQKYLRITRTYRTHDGQQYDRVEIVRRPALVDAYVRIREAPGGDEVVRDLAGVFIGEAKGKKAGKDDGDKPKPKRGRPAKIRPPGEVPKEKGQRGRKKRLLADQIKENLLGAGAGSSNIDHSQLSATEGGPATESSDNQTPNRPPKVKIKPITNMNKFKCSACGAVGHVRSNRNCPLYGKTAEATSSMSAASAAAAMSSEAGEAGTSSEPPKEGPNGESLIKVEETKLKIARRLVDHYNDMKRKTQMKSNPSKKLLKMAQKQQQKQWKTPTKEEDKLEKQREAMEQSFESVLSDEATPSHEVSQSQQGGESSMGESGKMKVVFKFGAASAAGLKQRRSSGASGTGSRRGSGVGEGSEPGKQSFRPSNRRIVDPLLALNNVFEKIVNPLRTNPLYEPFSLPVDTRSVPDYNSIVQRPMDLATMRKKCAEKCYGSRTDFLEDAMLLVTNARLYNGELHPITQLAQQVYENIVNEVSQLDAELVPLEKAANPLLEDDFRAFTFILTGVIDEMKRVEGSWPFHDPVPRKKVNFCLHNFFITVFTNFNF